jgi:succinyl-CoA synthetase alpha subunit
MRISANLSAAPGIRQALVAMATPVNLDLLSTMDIPAPASARPNDLMVAVVAETDEELAAALERLEASLAGDVPPPSTGDSPATAPRTTASAARGVADGVALVSTPGPYAFVEAMDALDAGLSVMVFSDNVPVEQEVRLKRHAGSRGSLVMGPDCGTAVVAGVGLGFANVVRPGPVGIVAASGTGAQQVMALLAAAGVGVSHCLGVGGRDLSDVVGGLSTHTALDWLDADPDTQLIVVLSKPPGPRVAASVRDHAARLGTPTVVAPLGPGTPDLTAVVTDVLGRLGVPVPTWPCWAPPAPLPVGGAGWVRGLYGGGTLCVEAQTLFAGPVYSNVPLDPQWTVGPATVGHVFLDLGADEFTVGRPHPMLDPTARLPHLERAAADPTVGVLLLDVVLGHGAHPDPASVLAPALATALRRDPPLSCVVSLVGTPDDPQDLTRQAEALAAAGASVYLSNAQAARHAALLTQTGTFRAHDASVPTGTNGGTPSAQRTGTNPGTPSAQRTGTNPGTPSALLTGQPSGVVTVGATVLADALQAQAVRTVRVDWRPPPAGTEDALARLAGDPRRPDANGRAVSRMLATGASLVDCRRAGELIGLERGQFCHAGPPLSWESASGPMRGALIGALLLEDLADGPESAERQLAAGRLDDGTPITLTPCHDRGGVGPMAGVVSPSMWAWTLRDEVHGNASWCTLNEGLGKVLRYGAYAPEVIERLRWMGSVLGPAFAAALRDHGPVDIKAIIGQMVQMGDEGHNRNRAGTLMLLRDLVPSLIESGLPPSDVARVARFVGGNDHFFLNLVMAAGKLQSMAAAEIPGSTVVTVMARNGTEFGIQTAGTGAQWFTGPAGTIEGMYLGAYGPHDANPDIGDSAITETIGLGGFAMAGAPAIVRFVGGTVRDALATSQRMYEITLAENPAYANPVLDFRGAPTGIDVTRVVRSGILPQINTGIAGRVAGTGQVGAGLVTPPMECFTEAVTALASAHVS